MDLAFICEVKLLYRCLVDLKLLNLAFLEFILNIDHPYLLAVSHEEDIVVVGDMINCINEINNYKFKSYMDHFLLLVDFQQNLQSDM